MGDAGSYWESALSDAGAAISRGIEERRKRNEQVDQTDQLINAFAKSGIDPESGQMVSIDPTNQKTVKPIIPTKMLDEWSNYTRGEKMKHAAVMETMIQVQEGLALNAAKARIQEANHPPFITDPVSGTRMYRTRGGYSPIKKTSTRDVDKAVSKYSASLGLTPEEFSQIDTNTLQMFDQFGKPIDSKSPLPPVYATGKVGPKSFRIPVKDIDRFKNMVGTAKQTPHERTRVGLPRVGEIRGHFRYKGGDPGVKDNWDPVE